MNQNPFDSLRQLGKMGEQLQKMFGEDFMKNLMPSHMHLPNIPGIPGIKGDSNAANPFQNLFQMTGGDYPRVDLYQTRSELIAVLEVPGLEKSSDVKLVVEPNRLVVKGNPRVRYSGIPDDQFILSERPRSFEREITLPVRVLPRKVRAFYRQGLLEVHMIKDAGPRGETGGSPIPIDFE
ncbi:Hsp20/alpha crystallin family protein [Effusibacillus pohliae]|uniref:Hsp20/alpha crystallin family protein n=1 Tax=Effusibacillus pohliae TaxID=232270 RepID=UPI0003688518|nr:Hsp20/alpha crystallin family protein [Effusibacillus pohliae]